MSEGGCLPFDGEDVRPIPGVEGYFVSSIGHVWSTLGYAKGRGKGHFVDRHSGFPRKLKLSIKKVSRYSYDYALCTLSCDGIQKDFRVHALVLSAFVGPRSQDQVCRHLNSIGTDNRLENLCWGTRKENEFDKKANGTFPCGEINGFSKLKESQVTEMRARRAAGEKINHIAQSLGLNPVTVGAVVRRQNWKHIP